MRRVELAAAMLMAAGPACAATVTFSGGTYLSGAAPIGTYVEDGVTVTPGSSFDFVTGHLDDGGSPYAARLTFTMAGPFDAVSFDLDPSESAAVLCDVSRNCSTPWAFENVQVTGYSGGNPVVVDTFDMFDVSGTYVFGSSFRNLDSLVIGFAPLPNDAQVPAGFTFACMAWPCTHFTIGNVQLTPAAPVPLPAAAWLLLGALGGLGAVGLRQRRRAA